MLDAGVMLPPSQQEAWFISAAHGDAELTATVDAARRAFGRIGSAERIDSAEGTDVGVIRVGQVTRDDGPPLPAESRSAMARPTVESTARGDERG
jgi:hypothetical protein